MSDFVKQHVCLSFFTTADSWVILTPLEQSIKQKIERKGVPLKNWNIQINYGIKTGLNEAFIINEEKRTEILSKCATAGEKERTEQIIRPILRGKDIERYRYNWKGLHIINFHNGLPEKNLPALKIEDYPALKAHFDNFLPQLRKRTDQGDSLYNLRSCAYLEDFNKQKICWNRIASKKQFALVEEGIFIQDSMHFIVGENLLYLCSILNSNLFQWLLSLIIGEAAGGNAGNADNVLNLCIPIPQENCCLSDEDIYSLFQLTKKEIEYIERTLQKQ